MKILLISNHIMGYMEVPRQELENMGHDVHILYYCKWPLKFKYKSFGQRLISFLRKINGNSIKKKHREDTIKEFTSTKVYDKILVTHPQNLNSKTHKYLKSITKDYIVYLFDGLKKMPIQEHYIHFFDEVFSYEPADCKKHNLKFITNFIPTERFRNSDSKRNLFNISSKDVRYPKLRKLAEYCHHNNIPTRFILFSKKPLKTALFQVISCKINIQQIDQHLKHVTTFVDIQRPEQNGLSFRVFEAMGNEKKLITNNSHIKQYPFYNPTNIHVIDFNNLHIPEEFLATPYQKTEWNLYQKYTAKNWVQDILSLN
ncbi:hypothetical protein KCTC52924_01601 [Arenibacter antarcticus]|uniref:Glycosyltransferase family 52 n=1 Tax=Arenibacter antarcticus TaxID=2040469 RepID=A0ABW5VH00_9FLAO|nr:hypothetical protein [Arenibacter sp. H213]MCM4166750.1 hypothetical protein [Arenibacter sp. H213]